MDFRLEIKEGAEDSRFWSFGWVHLVCWILVVHREEKECRAVEIHIGVTDAGAQSPSGAEVWSALIVMEVLCKS